MMDINKAIEKAQEKNARFVLIVNDNRDSEGDFSLTATDRDDLERRVSDIQKQDIHIRECYDLNKDIQEQIKEEITWNTGGIDISREETRTNILTYRYNPHSDELKETFGIHKKTYVDDICEKVEENVGSSATDFLINSMESGLIDGSGLMFFATLGIMECFSNHMMNKQKQELIEKLNAGGIEGMPAPADILKKLFGHLENDEEGKDETNNS